MKPFYKLFIWQEKIQILFGEKIFKNWDENETEKYEAVLLT